MAAVTDQTKAGAREGDHDSGGPGWPGAEVPGFVPTCPYQKLGSRSTDCS